jgi:hypothetical protein
VTPTPAVSTATFNQITAMLVDIDTQDELDAKWKEVEGVMTSGLTSQLAYDLALKGGLEASQGFDQKQYTFGGHAALDYKPWNNASTGARMNVFDHPFALLRVLTGYDDKFTPRGSSFPTFLVGIDRVMPDAQSGAAAGTTDDYMRLSGEVSFRTPIAASGSTRYFFDANYRIYRHLNPSDAVRGAHQQQQNFLQLAVTSSMGVFASYAKGKLPFDLQSGATYQLGYKFNFGQ